MFLALFRASNYCYFKCSEIFTHLNSRCLLSACRNSNVSGERSPFDGSCCSGQDASTESDVEEVTKYRVVLLGDSGVGKTALVSQFMTSEYMNTYDASLGKSLALM